MCVCFYVCVCTCVHVHIYGYKEASERVLGNCGISPASLTGVKAATGDFEHQVRDSCCSWRGEQAAVPGVCVCVCVCVHVYCKIIFVMPVHVYVDKEYMNPQIINDGALG